MRRRGASDGEGERVCTEPGLAKEVICAENTPCTVQSQHKMHYQFFSALIYLMDHQSCFARIMGYQNVVYLRRMCLHCTG